MIDPHAKPEKALLFGVLDRAIRDAAGLGWDCPEHLARGARKWFESNSIKAFSFLWICDHLDLDPELWRQAPGIYRELACESSRSKARMKPQWISIIERYFSNEEETPVWGVPSYLPVFAVDVA